MKTILKKTDINILKYLNNNNTISPKELEHILKKSETSIRNSIKNINNFFIENDLTPLKKINGKYSLPLMTSEDLEKFFIDETIELPAEERFNYLIFELILTEKVNLNEKAKLFNVTRKTLSLDLEEVKIFLAKRNLYLKSVPWKGIYLEGNNSDKICLGIQFIMKFLFEREFNDFTTKVHKKFLNPLLDRLYYQYIPSSVEKTLYKLTKDILKNYNIEGGGYFFNSFLASATYCYLKRNQTLDIISKDIPRELKNIKYDYLSFFSSKEFQNNYSFLKNNIIILANSLVRMHPFFYKYIGETDLETINILNTFEQEFNFKFTENWKIKFIQLLNVSKYKYKYNVKHFSCSSLLSENDSKIAIKIKEIFKQNNLYFYKEDINLILLFLKSHIMNYQLHKKQKNILILDCFYDCWLGNLIKQQLENKFFNLKIDVKSFYKIDNNNILEFNPNLIIYTEFDFNNFFPDINIKKQQVKYTNIFEYIDYFEGLGLF
ncbi:hypothetical protein [Cetobacterium somerae]|uniref:hypothetical protein n=1 Tax=Cetobacterium somerae TaxID=188913 RepID=UPI00248DBDDB|nr:hypothetical protein [Cetobacterium somerae]